MPRPLKVKEVTFEIAVKRDNGGIQWSYGTKTHAVILPNLKKFIKNKKTNEIILETLMYYTPEDVNHEILHKILHEHVSYRAMDTLDRIDKVPQEGGGDRYIISHIELRCACGLNHK